MRPVFQTGLEPLLEKLAMGEQLAFNFPPPAAPGLLARAGASAASGGRALANAARSGAQSAWRGLGALPRAAKGGLGAAALLGAGGLAYGALRQNDEDAQKLPQVHVPMTGSIYG